MNRCQMGVKKGTATDGTPGHVKKTARDREARPRTGAKFDAGSPERQSMCWAQEHRE